MYRDHVEFFPKRFGAFLDLQTQISVDFNDCRSRQQFQNLLLRQHTFDDLHVYTRDLFEYIPEIPRETDDDLDLRKIDFNF
jgi:hypothetical protein